MKQSVTAKSATPTNVASLKLLGDYWTLRIIDTLSAEPVGFCELQRRADNINPVTLTGRLKKLEDSNLISKSDDPGCEYPGKYALTDLGRQALPVLWAVERFSERAGTSGSD